MKTYDSQNRLVREINTTFLQDGSVVTSNTVYNPNSGQAALSIFPCAERAGEGHNEKHIWWKVAALGTQPCLAPGYISPLAPHPSVFAASLGIRIARSMSTRLMQWSRAIRTGMKSWRRTGPSVRSRKKSRSFARCVTARPKYCENARSIAIVFYCEECCKDDALNLRRAKA